MSQKIIIGIHPIQELLRSQTTVHMLYIDQNKRNHSDIKALIPLLEKKQIKYQFVDRHRIESIAEKESPGICAICEYGPQYSLSEIIKTPDQYPCIVVADHLEDPFNFGNLIRTCEAFGIEAIVYAKKRQSPISAGVIKSASGATEHVKLIQVSNIHQTLKACKKAGYWIYGTHISEGVPLQSFKPQFPAVIVAGNESNGMSPIIQKECDAFINIPMYGRLQSLNVGVAMGISIQHVMSSFYANKNL